jgi:acetyl esterase
MSKTMTLAATLVASVIAVSSASAQTLERGTQAFVDSLSGPPLYTLTPTAARDVLSTIQRSAKITLAPASIHDLELPIGPTGHTRVRVVRPEGAKGQLPTIIYIHGGGWVIGDKDTHDRLVRELAVSAKAVLVFVDYDRSPEARWPTAIEQGYAVTQYVAGHGREFGADTKRLVIAGDSVGGNMAAVVAMLAKKRHGPHIAAQLLFYPVTDASMTTGSYQQFAEGPWLTAKAMAWFWDAYEPDLPQTLLLVDENDVLRDEGETYGRHLAAAGVRVTTVRYNGTIHDFMMLNPIATTPAVRGAVNQAISYLNQVFAGR